MFRSDRFGPAQIESDLSLELNQIQLGRFIGWINRTRSVLGRLSAIGGRTHKKQARTKRLVFTEYGIGPRGFFFEFYNLLSSKQNLLKSIVADPNAFPAHVPRPTQRLRNSMLENLRCNFN